MKKKGKQLRSLLLSALMVLALLPAITTQVRAEGTGDATAPTIADVSPNNASENAENFQIPFTIGAHVDGSMEITFSEAMNTQAAGTVSLDHSGGTLDAVHGSWSSDGKVYTIAYSGLSYNIKYTATISGFKDALGNIMADDATHYFTTAKDAIYDTTAYYFTDKGNDPGLYHRDLTVYSAKSGSKLTGISLTDSANVVTSIPSANYSCNASDDGMAITISKAYLATLSSGVYTLTYAFDGSDTDTVALTVEPNYNYNAEDVAINARYSYTPTSTGAVTLAFKANDSKKDSTDTYTVTLTVSPDSRSSAKAITAFTINNVFPINGTITEATHKITVVVYSGDLASLKADVKVSDKATVSPASGTEQDFTKPVTYRVTAEDGSWQDYIVNVTTDPQTDTSWYTGSGSYTINSAHELAGLAVLVNNGITFSGKTITLGKDINLSDFDWTPIGISSTQCFLGTFDGAGHTISGLTIGSSSAPRTTGKYIGLFGYLGSGSVIENLTIDGASIYSDDNGTYVGALAGCIGLNGNSGCTISGCAVTSSEVNISTQQGNLVNVGILIGFSDAILENCSVKGCTLRCSANLAHGNNYIILCDAGGLVGIFGSNTMTKCSVTETTIIAEGEDYQIGGLIGANVKGTIKECYATIDVIGPKYSLVGGLIGSNSLSTIINCYTTGNISCDEGWRGYYDGLDFFSYVGGLVGRTSSSTFTNSFATGTVTGKGTQGSMAVGGFAGYFDNNAALNCSATGDVSGGGKERVTVGGFAGDIIGSSTILNCFAAGKTAVTDAYENVNINYAGGFAGRCVSSTLKNAYFNSQNSTGVGNGTANVTGLSAALMNGTSGGTVTYFTSDEDTTGTDTASFVKALNSGIDLLSSKYPSYTFTKWCFTGSGYPVMSYMAVPVTQISVTSDADNLKVGDTLQMNVSILPEDASNKSVTWSVTNGTGSATIDKDGLLTAVSGGAITVTATANDGSEVCKTVPITVKNIQSSAKAITAFTLSGVTAPTSGATPVTSITETDQYTGTVLWAPDDSTFTASTTYTATITLTPKTGYTLTGVAKDFFKVSGAASVSNDINSGVITVVFPKTDAEPEDCLVTYCGAQKHGNENGTYDIRFIAVTNTLSADKVGFVFSKSKTEPTLEDSTVKATTTVYTSILASGKMVTAKELGGTYLIACTVNDIPAEDAAKPLYVRAFSTVAAVTQYTQTVTVTADKLP